MLAADLSLVELAFEVGHRLHSKGIRAVLSGGAAACVYSGGEAQSRDLDFVLSFQVDRDQINEALADTGFQFEQGMYRHPNLPFTLEFLRSPVQIDDEFIAKWNSLESQGRVLEILSPTDCVRDRLCWFFFYRTPDFAALSQALEVVAAKRDEVDLDAIRTWASQKRALERFTQFERRVQLLPDTKTIMEP